MCEQFISIQPIHVDVLVVSCEHFYWNVILNIIDTVTSVCVCGEGGGAKDLFILVGVGG